MIEQEPTADSRGEFIAFHESGERAKGAFRCVDCRYGIVVTAALPVCPMCGGRVWESGEWSPFGRSSLL